MACFAARNANGAIDIAVQHIKCACVFGELTVL